MTNTVRGGRVTSRFCGRAMINVCWHILFKEKLKHSPKGIVKEASKVAVSFFICISIVNHFSCRLLIGGELTKLMCSSLPVAASKQLLCFICWGSGSFFKFCNTL